MKNMKRVLAALAAAAIALGLTACGGGGETSGTGNGEGEYDQVVYAYATFNNIPATEDLAPVQEAINEITREKIGVEVTLMPISVADYTSKVSLSLQGGEKIDVYQSLGNFNSCVASDMCYDISELIDEYGAGAKEVVGDNFLDACRVNGALYGIPTYKPYALTPMLIYREDIAQELGLDIDSIQSVNDITPLLEQVKSAYPNMTPLAPVQSGTIGLHMCMGDVDWLSDDYYNPVGVLLDNNTTVTDLYTSDVFKERAQLARTWHENDLVMKDAATTTTTAAEAMASGNYFGYIAAYSLQAQCGNYDIAAKILDDAFLSTGDINAVSWMIASTTDVPKAALAFLDLTYTDEDIINLLIYGIEGRDYVLNEDGTVSYPEGEDSTTVPYTAQLSCGTLGNFFKMYPTEGTNPESLAWEEAQNKEAETSVAMGFTFDSSSLKTQYTAVKNVISQYLPGLLCGSLDPDTELEKFEQALMDAGYQDILDAKQEQLDAWLAQQ